MVNNQEIVLLESFPHQELFEDKKSESIVRTRSDDSGVLSIDSSIQEEDESKDELEEFSNDAKLCLSLIKKLKNCFLDEKFSKDEKLAGQISKIKKSIQFSATKKNKKSKDSDSAKENRNSETKKSNQKKKRASNKATADVLNESTKNNQQISLKKNSNESLKSTNDSKKNSLSNDKSDKKETYQRSRVRANTFSNDERTSKPRQKRNSLSESTERKSSTPFLSSRFSDSLLRLPIGPSNRDNGFRDRLKRGSLQFD